MGYEYITENNLYHKQNYMYSQFKGRIFFDEYMKSREVVYSVNDCCEKTVKEESETYLNILNIFNYLNSNKENKLEELDFYLKSFEVRKRLYTSYSGSKPIENASFEDYDIYVLFAEVLVKAYGMTKCLKYFSCLLKVDDTLLSIQDKLDQNQREILKQIVNKEMEYFKELCEKHGIEGENICDIK